MNSDKSWISNYDASLRNKEENFDNVCFESSKPTGKVHKIRNETKVKPSSCFGKPMPPRCGGGSGGSSNLMSIHPRTKVRLHKERDPSKGQNLDCNSWMPDVRNIFFETLIFKDVLFDTLMNVKEKRREQCIGMS